MHKKILKLLKLTFSSQRRIGRGHQEEGRSGRGEAERGEAGEAQVLFK